MSVTISNSEGSGTAELTRQLIVVYIDDEFGPLPEQVKFTVELRKALRSDGPMTTSGTTKER